MKMKNAVILIVVALSAVFGANSARIPEWPDGSMTPYPVPDTCYAVPDSLTPFFLNHIGRHGARFLSSEKKISKVRGLLADARKRGSLTQRGEDMYALLGRITARVKGRWGALDSLGMEEESGIGRRMAVNFPEIFDSGPVCAISSFVPRAVMSMYACCHSLSGRSPALQVATDEGRQFDKLLRFFDTDPEYVAFLDSGDWREPLDRFSASTLPEGPASELLGDSYPLTGRDARGFALDIYGVLQSLEAASMPMTASSYMSADEYQRCWKVANLMHYLRRTATDYSAIPARAAIPLLNNMIEIADSVVDGSKDLNAFLRFGHAETIMPLFSLMGIPGADYVTSDCNSVAEHWQDYTVVPLAVNLQIIYFHSPSGRVYCRVDVNERPVSMIADRPDDMYVEWDILREQLLKRISLFKNNSLDLD